VRRADIDAGAKPGVTTVEAERCVAKGAVAERVDAFIEARTDPRHLRLRGPSVDTHLQDESCPPEVNQLGRTILRWTDQITAWHRARVSNGPTEAVNNLIKRVKRVAFGFRRFAPLPDPGPATPDD
jgi:hypothetical protein